jgi:hypothetical protein
MTANLDALPARVEAIEHKLDALALSVDRRFDEVTQAFVEQRQYTEFAFGQLERRMNEGFTRLERKLDQFIDSQSQPSPRRKTRRRKP